MDDDTHDRASASYPALRSDPSHNFFIHWQNSRLSCILHLYISAFEYHLGYDSCYNLLFYVLDELFDGYWLPCQLKPARANAAAS